jgi:hypothetical protein
MNKGHKITYSGKVFSLNQLYAGQHWAIRVALKKKWRATFTDLILAEMEGEKLKTFTINVKYRTRLDADNMVGVVKVFVDSLAELGIIENDSPKYMKGIMITYDDSLPMNTTEFYIHRND